MWPPSARLRSIQVASATIGPTALKTPVVPACARSTSQAHEVADIDHLGWVGGRVGDEHRGGRLARGAGGVVARAVRVVAGAADQAAARDEEPVTCVAIGEQLARDLRLAVLLARDAVVRRRREHGGGLVDSRLGLGGVDAAARDIGPVASAWRQGLQRRADEARLPRDLHDRVPVAVRDGVVRGGRRAVGAHERRSRRGGAAVAAREARHGVPAGERFARDLPPEPRRPAEHQQLHRVPSLQDGGENGGRPRLCESWTTPWTRSPAHCATGWSTGPASRRAERTRRGGSRRSWSGRPACSTRHPRRARRAGRRARGRAGPLEPLLRDPEVDEIMVSGTGAGVGGARRAARRRPTSRSASEAELRHVIERILAPLGRRADEAEPLCDARLPGRLARERRAPAARARRPGADDPPLPPARLRAATTSWRAGRSPPPLLDFLARAVRARCTLLIAAATGSGKTTTLGALAASSIRRERIVTIEDAAELRLGRPHVVRLEARPPNLEGRGEVTIRRLVRNALRMRPDRLIVGEVRGAEALDLLVALSPATPARSARSTPAARRRRCAGSRRSR